jgi:hypothetical protein
MSPETIRANALDCVRLAEQTYDREQKTLLLSIADLWMEFARAARRSNENPGAKKKIGMRHLRRRQTRDRRPKLQGARIRARSKLAKAK